MKQKRGKPLRHKEGNTFAFKSFNARIGDIAVDLRQQMQLGSAWKPSGDACFLSEASAKWSDLNRTRHFGDFQKEIRSKVQNYALVVHNKDEIAEALQRHLRVEDSLALEPLLDYVVNFARDIQDDFYPYFEPSFRIFLDLLSRQEAEVIEWVFSCLAQLFRILKRPMVKNFEAVFSLMAELLDESTKPYISRFATESFAFLIRSFKDPSGVIEFLLLHCKKYRNLAKGIGELMFEAVKNINHAVHSFFDKFYAVLLNRLRSEAFNETSIRSCISTMTEHLGKYLTKETSLPFWTVLFDAMNSRDQVFSPYYLLILAGMMDARRGGLIQEPNRVVDGLSEAISSIDTDDEEVSTTAVNSTALLMEHVHLNTDLQHRRRLARTVFTSKISSSAKLCFVEQVLDIPMFEVEVLPHLLDFCLKLYPSNIEAVMKCLTTVVLRKDSAQFQPNGIRQWKPLMLDFSLNNPHIRSSSIDSFVVAMLDSVEREKDSASSRWSKLWSLLVVLPHVSPRVSQSVLQRVFAIAGLARSALTSVSDGDKTRERSLCQILHASTVAASELSPQYDTVKGGVSLEDFLPLLWRFGNDVSVLSTLCCVMQSESASSSTTKEMKDSILTVLKPNLRSSSHAIRQLSLQCLTVCCPVKETKTNPVFHICLQAEQVEASIQEYREKLRFLRMLEAGQVQASGILEDPSLNDVPLLYLFGCLKIGFQPVWKEIRTLIASYRALLSKSLWSVLEAELKLVSDEAESAATAPTTTAAGADGESSPNSLSDIMASHVESLMQTETNSLNPFKYRTQLWQTVLSISDTIEARNRCFSDLFQRFMRNEFIPATLLSTTNNTEDRSEERHDSSRKSRSEAEETCLTMLELFAAFRNPIAVFQEPLVRSFYMDLLTYRSPKVQSAALRCLFNYKFSYLQPYEVHLIKLLDDKDMWNTLTEIEFGAANPVIEEEDRLSVMPIILRILFGRMQMNSKARNTDKSTPKGRKNGIVRALANCRDHEFQYFLDLVLQPFEKGEKKEVHLKLADGILHTLFVIIDELRTGLGQSLHQVYGTIVGILSVVRQKVGTEKMEDGSNEAERSTGGLLKKLRKECYKCLTKFCSVFPSTVLTSEEKDALFAATVWPEIDIVTRDGPLTVTPLMRLFSSWSQNTTYHAYFSEATGKAEENILVFLARILDPGVASRSASIKLVIDVFNNLLYPQLEVTEDEKEEEVEEKTIALTEQGLSLLRPCVNTILKYLHEKIKRHLDAKKIRKGSPLSDADLKLAVGVSDMVLDTDQSEALSDILLRLLSCGEIKKESELLGLLEIEKRLVLSINPVKLSKSVRPLISMLSRSFTRDARMKICETLSIIADRRNTESARELASIANDLLSWSVRHVEEPDYERRGAAYQSAKDRIIAQRDNMTDLDLPLLVLHIADYDIRQSTDIMSSSLRDFGLMCILTIVRCYGSTPGGLVILEHVMKLVKEALKSKAESVRNAYVAVLGEVVDFYPRHAMFSELLFLRYPLSLKGTASDKCTVCNGVGLPSVGDLQLNEGQIQNGRTRCKCYNQELDVFENLRHIQKHRVGAALHEVAVWTAAKVVPVSTVMQLFMPLATAHLCNDQYTSDKYQGLIDAVIEIVGSVCAVVPWTKYEPMLKHFLAVLTRKPLFHKQIIRVVVAIVDSFHFDLSSVDVTRTNFKSKEKLTTTIDMGELPDAEDADVEMEEAPPADAAEAPAGSLAKPDATTNAKAEKVYRSLMHFILPGLSKLMTDKVAGDESHKLTADLHVGEKEEILRAPVALAIVKLLQKLPEKVVRRQISGVFLKIGRLLKSRLLSIRQSARETLTEIMISLGPSYLPTLIKELRGVLQRGYQIHVLVHCVHMLLTKMLPQLKSGSLDRALSDLVQICHNEMFGELAEEKEVTALTRKIAEARNIKSYDTYAILARFVSPTVLLALIKPLKDKAEEIQSHKIAVKLEKALRQILTGLMKNEQLSEKDLLLFCYALHDPSMGLFQAGKPKKLKAAKVLPEHLKRPDSYLIQAEPGRMGPMPVVNRKTNDYLLHNFGLQLLLSCFKSGRLAALSSEATEMLDPFVPLVIKCVTSSHIPIRTSALRCLIWMLKFKLPSLESEMSTVVRQLFVHLKNYSGPGAAVAENAEFVTTVYKALSATVREATFYKLSDKHLKVLLTYAENDFREGTKHILAANLLRAVLSRHLLTTELREIMLNIATVSIQSEQESLREECRQLVTVFLTTYHAKKIKAKEFVELYQDNLEYSMEYGRLISMAVLCDLLFKMGEGFQKEYALTFFQLFAARLSDESSTVRQNAAKYISLILHITDITLMTEVAKWVKRWLVDQEGAVRRIGLQVASLMVEWEKEAFLPRLAFVLPSLDKILLANEIALTDEAIAQKDHLLINALNLLAKILEGCGNTLWKDAAVTKKLKSIFVSVQELLLHEHQWVRIKSMDIVWNIFQLQAAAELPTNMIFAEETVDKLRELTKRLLHMLKSYSERDDYYQVWSSCILYIVQAVLPLPQGAETKVGEPEADAEEDVKVKEEDDDEEENDRKSTVEKLTADFIVRSICREAVYEALHDPRKTTKRLQVVIWIRRLTEDFDKSAVIAFLPNIAHVLYRCTNEPSAQKNEELKRTTEEVSVAVESRVGREAYASAMRDVILVASKKRTARKRQQAVEPILHPEKAARKRIKKQQSKKEARKRKLEDIEVGRVVKAKRTPRQ